MNEVDAYRSGHWPGLIYGVKLVYTYHDHIATSFISSIKRLFVSPPMVV